MVYTLGMILVTTLIVTIFNYFNLLKGLPLNIIEFLIPLISIFIGSFFVGKASSNKGYLEGIKYGGIWLLLMLIFNLITKGFTLFSILFYIAIILISVGGAILGINIKKEKA